MKTILFKGYNRLTGLFWIVMGFAFFTMVWSYVPFWAALAFCLSSLVPYYFSCSYLTNYLQPRAMRENKMKFFIVQFLIASLVMAFIYVSTSYLFYILQEHGYFPESKLFDETSPIIKEVFATLPTFILLNVAFCGFRFYYEHTKLQRSHLESQLQMLQAQVNPHYMFNILNHLHILMRKDVDKATFLLEKYSEILRYQLYNSKKETVTLSQETNFIKDVISIERLRWGDELSVEATWDIEDNWGNIPPLILIAFVENAFKHVSRSISEKGYIKLLLRQKNNVIYMEIENSKWKEKSITPKDSNSRIGISNTKERLEILYPKKHTLSISETDWVFKVELTIVL